MPVKITWRFLFPFFAALPIGVSPVTAQDEVIVSISRASGLVADMRDALAESDEIMARWETEIARSERMQSEGRSRTQLAGGLRKALSDGGFWAAMTADCRNAVDEASASGAADEADLNRCVNGIKPSYALRETLECSSLRWEVSQDGQVKIAGHVSNPEDLVDLQNRYGFETVQDVVERPWPVCGAVKALELPMTSGLKPEVEMLSGSPSVRFDQSLAFKVDTPEFYAFLYVSYLQADGSVVNLTPRNGAFRTQYPPGTQVNFGDGRNGRQSFTASPPAGDEAIVVIAARSPINELEELEQSSDGQYRVASAGAAPGPITQGDFINLLAQSLGDTGGTDAATDEEREVSAEILHLTIMP